MPRKKEIIKVRNKHIVEDFDLLYNKKRKRLDDVYEALSKKFYLSPGYIMRILTEMADEPLNCDDTE